MSQESCENVAGVVPVGDSETTTLDADIGVSTRALSLAREIDRLPPGEYIAILVKHHVEAVPWHFVLHKADRIRVMDIGK